MGLPGRLLRRQSGIHLSFLSNNWPLDYRDVISNMMLGIQVVLPQMKENGACIINIPNTAGMSGSDAYTASKGGIYAITRAATINFEVL
ncbi:hypothetical protein [Elizabethkingia meningoseptica]|uniref:hypothetical protein n=1 Tax=Elizabethkingia meningoseptica TaxID=238 RepID=UPI00389252F2